MTARTHIHDHVGTGRGLGLTFMLIITVASMVIAGATVGWSITRNQEKLSDTSATANANTDVLVALCSSLTTLRFVFEQLEALDRRLARNPTLSPTVRADVRVRADLYATAVLALSDQRECARIE